MHVFRGPCRSTRYYSRKLSIQLQSMAGFAVGPVCALNFEGRRFAFETRLRGGCQRRVVVVTSSGEGTYGTHLATSSLAIHGNTDSGNGERRCRSSEKVHSFLKSHDL